MGLEPQKKKRRRSLRQKMRKELPPRLHGRNAPFVPTDARRRKVENVVAADFSTIEIAAALDISTSTLEEHFRAELVGGRNKVHTDIANGILQGARDGDRTLQIYEQGPHGLARESRRRRGPRQRRGAGPLHHFNQRLTATDALGGLKLVAKLEAERVRR
jgi:hypothetical protein